jgi:hypothetical protein
MARPRTGRIPQVNDREARIVRAIGELGPLTGAELLAAVARTGEATVAGPGDEAFCCWKAAMLSSRLVVKVVGRRFLRLDREIDGYARLSPSILREFLTYSVVGLAADAAALDRRAAEVLAHIRAVSRAKLDLAGGVVTRIAERIDGGGGADDFCVIIAGDVVYDMAHDVPRPERSTGAMVRGSDLDLVVIVDDAAPEALLQRLDEAIYRQKYRHLINPSAREEIDYIVKRLERLREQAAFDTFERMVACKILQEGVLLHGNATLFDAAKALLREYSLTDRLAEMDAAAARLRGDAERRLLSSDRGVLAGEELRLFYPVAESEEFE